MLGMAQGADTMMPACCFYVMQQMKQENYWQGEQAKCL
jgi:hypothetical protein